MSENETPTKGKATPAQIEDAARAEGRRPEPVAVKKRFWSRGVRLDQPRRLRRGDKSAVILRLGGATEVHAMKGPYVEAADGWYIAEPGGRFWLDQAIPRGWVTVYLEGDAEPVSTRKPNGYGPLLIQMLCGHYTTHLVGGGLQSSTKLTPWMKKILLIGGAALAALAFGYTYAKNKGLIH